MTTTKGCGAFGMFIAFAGGAVLGAAIGLLLAPETGAESRRRLAAAGRSAKRAVECVPGLGHGPATATEETLVAMGEPH